MKTYRPTIGIEVHAELKTETKMFCGSKNEPHAAEANTHVCPVCLAHPGTLPVINKEAVEHVIKVGIALGGSIASFTEFDRKNYFYPDIPKGYQISQYKYPIVSGGELAGVAITRVHLEEDTARSLHDQGDGSLVDYNRAGVPLMELVTEPVIHDAKTAGDFARELQLLLRTLGVSDANMEKGEMRVEANISVSPDDTFGTKVEVKNLNSFKAVEGAINYEIRRQIAILEQNNKEISHISQETRGWDETKGETFSQRSKESAAEYRYFPDPDLPKLDIARYFDTSLLKEKMPALPSEKRLEYTNLGLAREQVDLIISDDRIASYFAELARMNGGDLEFLKRAANYLTSDVLALLGDSDKSLEFVHMGSFSELIHMITRAEITSRVAKDLLPEVIFDGVNPATVVAERGLGQESSTETLLTAIQEVIAEQEAVVAEYKGGKESTLQFLVGQGMKKTKGSANPQLLADLFRKELS
ncbi:Asp-tRNA(Asn)/Glu-tRNA(Gln) amidotransferase subunit GatB [Candidatus Kaiserbacteria bacterium CG10_big_fil_rev_8_21_14_0_10_47_16]|uniref:Aspartyl/glutamyl-tRNA(Asn/Gln) amidotransferase subunit B n=1 Tax=Candidatus Kaiserbacteria bacterium CG10_big_fil_rev_8_21_14_0_10_47_16 TaxID=1974608 RepID=A0A2H0UEV0_9BACT|nr:MAG: Asp-tRNA(Asn)/Glu-tRNA(Gln) amidotransferase subunit GatB [Candidatus Kaiserbacteria bacterium CG10_big_fil_rev_8_21_14_0_10_47_16]